MEASRKAFINSSNNNYEMKSAPNKITVTIYVTLNKVAI